jgi:type IV pilus assembly protein PilM
VKEKIPSSVGLDVGQRHISMVELTGIAPSLKLLDFASIKLNPGQGKEQRLEQLQKLVQEKELFSLPVSIGISGESVIVRYIDLPKMDKKEMAQALKYEAQQYIPFKMEEVVFDYHILEPLNSNQNRMKVLLVAAKKEAIMDFVELIHSVGLKPNLIDVNSFSLINCFQLNGPKLKPDDTFALVNLEFDLASINILQGEIPFFTRDISTLDDMPALRQDNNMETGIFEAVRPLLENLIRELRLSIDYYESEFEKQVCMIYLSGEGAGVTELLDFCSTQLGREVRLWNPLQNLVIDSEQFNAQDLAGASSMLAVACGLALRGVQH